MTMSLNACVKRKHPRTSGNSSKCPLKSECPVILFCPHLNDLTRCVVKIPSLPGILRFVTCPSQGTVDACDSVCHSPREKVNIESCLPLSYMLCCIQLLMLLFKQLGCYIFYLVYSFLLPNSQTKNPLSRPSFCVFIPKLCCKIDLFLYAWPSFEVPFGITCICYPDPNNKNWPRCRSRHPTACQNYEVCSKTAVVLLQNRDVNAGHSSALHSIFLKTCFFHPFKSKNEARHSRRLQSLFSDKVRSLRILPTLLFPYARDFKFHFDPRREVST
ncbi:hypothetical protein AVEN_46227-1 [Araneus ventricosus]|uniref:Uncharacterized protein n=1 Tax=Araneus ventricosus TaxID=182803 RepID=A0A4Y2ALP5_ARAVE|nr:hypothetical protein AVEN_46227-1 [Araneus ventricosus]